MNEKTQKINLMLDNIALILIGLFSLGYSLFLAGFAELHLSLPFLDFPIFIGEILLFLCIVLFIIKWKVNHYQYSSFYKLFSLYIIFILIKAFSGYLKWGPLAFRDAALFYYPIFAILGYHFYNRGFFSSKKILWLFSIFILIIASSLLDYFYVTRAFAFFNPYYLLTNFILAVILIKYYPYKLKRYLLLSIFLILTPYQLLFATSRTGLASNLAGGLFILVAIYSILKLKKSYKIGVFVAFIAVASLCVMKASDENAVKSLLNVQAISDKYNEYNKILIENKDSYKMKEFEKVRLYIPEAERLATRQRNVLAKPKLVKTLEDEVSELERKVSEGQLELARLQTGGSLKLDAQGGSRLDLIQPSTAELSQPTEDALKTTSQAVELIAPTSAKASQPSTAELSQPAEDALKTTSQAAESIAPTSANGSRPSTAELSQSTEDALKTTSQAAESIMPKPIDEPQTEAEKLAKEEMVQQEIKMAKSEIEQVQALLDQMKFGKRHLSPAEAHIFFRIFIWKDMAAQFKENILKKNGSILAIFGVDFGKPLRSKSIEILKMAEGDWRVDYGGAGWITPHNSLLHILYRSGIVGIAYLLTLFFVLVRMVMHSIRLKSINGILLCGVFIHWIVMANFLVILELPYNAIPFWSLFGMTAAYLRSLQVK